MKKGGSDSAFKMQLQSADVASAVKAFWNTAFDEEFMDLLGGKMESGQIGLSITRALEFLANLPDSSSRFRSVSICLRFYESPAKFLLTGVTKSGKGVIDEMNSTLASFLPMLTEEDLANKEPADKLMQKNARTRGTSRSPAWPEAFWNLNLSMVRRIAMMALQFANEQNQKHPIISRIILSNGSPLEELKTLMEKHEGLNLSQIKGLDETEGIRIEQLQMFEKEMIYYERFDAETLINNVIRGDNVDKFKDLEFESKPPPLVADLDEDISDDDNVSVGDEQSENLDSESPSSPHVDSLDQDTANETNETSAEHDRST